MKFSILTLVAICFIFCSDVFAQDNNPLASVRWEFREASVVARVMMLDTEPKPGDGYAYEFIVSCRVLQVFKGHVKPGQILKFTDRAEYNFDHKRMRGDAIAFLTSFVNRKYGPFQVLPDGNSVDPYSPGLAAKVRRVVLSSHGRRYHRI